jgi:metallo-beta-lactamase family protein
MSYVQLGEQKRSPGATSHGLFNINGKNIIVDSGMGIANKKVDENYFPIDPQKQIDLIVITHHHLDHCGNLATIAKMNPNAVIIMTKPTSAGAYIMLNDALKIATQDQKRAQKEKLEVKSLPFDKRDIFDAFRRTRPVTNPGWYSIWPGWQIGFYSAGHTRGATMVFIIPPEGSAYFFTGDISSHDQPLVKGVMLPPKEFFGDHLKGKSIVMVTETTYGNRELSKPMPELQKEFQAFMKAKMRERIQSLLPSFADRGPALLKLLTDAGIACHVDGMVQDFCRMYAENSWCEQDILLKLDELIAKKLAILYPKLDKTAAQEEHESANRHRADTALGSCCGISYSPIISSSAMLDQGRSVQHAEKILPNRKATVVFTGYMFPGSLGEEVMRVKKGNTVKLNAWDSKLRKSFEKPVPVSCEVAHFGLSGHDEAPKLVERVVRFHELCRELDAELAAVVGHHGDDENYAGFERRANALALGIPMFRGEHLKELPL